MSTGPLSWEDRVELAERFAPHLVLFPEDKTLARPGQTNGKIGDYHPRGIGPLLERSRLSTSLFKHQPSSLAALSDCKNADAQLLILGRAFPNPQLAWQSYFEILDSEDRDGKSCRERFPVTIYARVQSRSEANAQSSNVKSLGDEMPPFENEIGAPLFSPTTQDQNDVAIQYWFCYYYDDWANQHEGDWEGICIFLHGDGRDYSPAGASYYAHETGLRRRWQDIERTAMDDHPLVYVAAGSHASYFQYVDPGYLTTIQNYILPIVGLKINIGLKSSHLDVVPDCQHFAPVKPNVELLPDPVGPDDENAPVWKNAGWLAYPGKWGVNVLWRLGFGGPRGPRQKGLKWYNPFVWMERHCTPDFLVY